MLLSLALLTAQPAFADWPVVVSVQVASTKADGEAWDVMGGAPDIGICVVTASNTACDPSKLGKCQDAFSCSLRAIVPDEAFTVWVYDLDLSANDTIGAATCNGRGFGNGAGLRHCDVSDRVTSMTISK